MAAFKITTAIQGVMYEVPNGQGDLVKMYQGQPTVRGAVPTMTMVVGGNSITMTQANAADLLAAWTSFSTTGIVS